MADSLFIEYQQQFGYPPQQTTHLIAFAKTKDTSLSWEEATDIIKNPPTSKKLSNNCSIGDEIEFNSDPEDTDDIKSHIHQGTIVKILQNNSQIAIKLIDGAIYNYFVDDIHINTAPTSIKKTPSKINEENKQSIATTNNQEFTNPCTSISSCLSIGRIQQCLKFYQGDLEYDLLLKYFSDDYPFLLLLNDFNHILAAHICSDQQSIQKSKKDFELIYNAIIKEIGSNGCDVQKCKRFNRHNRNRENHKLIISKNENSNNSWYGLQELYVDVLDTIHCCLIHSVDNGFRLLTNDQKKDDDDDNDEKEINYIDNEMKRIKNLLNEKRKLLSKTNANNRFKNNKFMTKTIINNSNDHNTAVLFIDDLLSYLLKEGISSNDVNKLNQYLSENDYDTDSINEDIYNNDIDDSYIFLFCNSKIFFDTIKQYIITQQNDNAQHRGSYSFGFRYYYWAYYEKNGDKKDEWCRQYGYTFCELYIPQKYSSLKDEILNNSIHTLDLYSFNTHVVQKAKQLIQTKIVKQMTADESYLNDKYEIKQGTPITLEHLSSVILYCNYSELSTTFTATFRRSEKNQNINNCKLRNQQFRTWSKLLRETVEIYGKRVDDSVTKIYFHGLSNYLVFSSFVSHFASPTSTSCQMEVALRFAGDDGLMVELKQYHGVLRCFNCSWLSCFSEEDERLFCGGSFPLQFNSIRDVAIATDYIPFIHAITSLNYAIDGRSLININNHKCISKDLRILKKLVSGENEFSSYINKTFAAFCMNKKMIKINVDYMNSYYKKILSLLLDEYVPLINAICDIFTNCHHIQIEYNLFDEPLISSFFPLFYSSELSRLSAKKLNITLTNVNLDDDSMLNKYQSKLSENKCQITKENDDTISISYRQM